jgi:hypothetical protein
MVNNPIASMAANTVISRKFLMFSLIALSIQYHPFLMSYFLQNAAHICIGGCGKKITGS